MNKDTVELEDEGQSKEKPKRKTRAEKREERKHKDKSKVEKVAEKNVKMGKDSPEKSKNKLSRRENKRIKQRRKGKTDPLKRNFKTKWWLRQERLKNYQTSRHQHYKFEKHAEIHEIEPSQVRFDIFINYSIMIIFDKRIEEFFESEYCSTSDVVSTRYLLEPPQ